MNEATDRNLKANEAHQAIVQSVDEAIAHFEAPGSYKGLAEVRAWVGGKAEFMLAGWTY